MSNLFKIDNIVYKKIYPDKIIAPCIHVYNNIIDLDIEKSISKIEFEGKDYWQDSQTIGNTKEYRTSQSIDLSLISTENIFFAEINNHINNAIVSTSVPYAEKYDIGSIQFEGFSLNKYENGKEYKAHYDGNTETGRSFSAVFYLNDSYSGGEIEFINFDLKFKPEKNSLIVFPSNFSYSHIANKVESGTKYIVVSFIRDRNV